jgi:hypothetical protein
MKSNEYEKEFRSMNAAAVWELELVPGPRQIVPGADPRFQPTDPK